MYQKGFSHMSAPRIRFHRFQLLSLTLLSAALLALGLPGARSIGATGVAAIAAQPSDDDFFTQELGQPVNMTNPDDIDIWATTALDGLSNVTVSNGGNGLFEATAKNGDPRVYVRLPTPIGAVSAPYDGGFLPIDANQYRYLTVRIWVSAATVMQATWQAVAGSQYGQSSFVNLTSGWNTVTTDLTASGTGKNGAGWSGQIQGLYIDPTTNLPGPFKIDFIRLSKNPTAIPISWDGNGLNGSVNILVGSANDGSDAATIATGISASGGSYTWNTSLPGGNYHVFVRQGGANVGGSPLALTVAATPQLNITAPSYISGPDYATTVASNPWDMSDSADAATVHVTNLSFSNGILSGANVNGNNDPEVNLNVPTAIDSSKFKYATYRMQVDTMTSPFNAPVARYLWWAGRPEDSSTSEDIVVYQGYRTLSYDLTKLPLDPAANTGSTTNQPWTSRNPTVFRLDPHEYTQSYGFNLDYVMLTGNDQASQSFDIRYEASASDGATPSLQFFYDSDNSGFNGAAIACGAVVAVAPASTNNVYLPLMMRMVQPPPISPTGATCRWNTASIPAGTYYVYGVAANGPSSYRVYSQTPVEIKH
jgi:hypothetical protein